MGELISMWRAGANAWLGDYEPLVLVLFSLAVSLFTFVAASLIHLFLLPNHGLHGAVTAIFITTIRLIPGVRGYIEREKGKVVDKLQSSVKSGRENWQSELPRVGLGRGVIERLNSEKSKDVQWQGRCSGTVYIGGSESDGHFSLINEAYSMFAHTNPLHLDVFPSIARFEGEVVAMTASFLGSREKSSGGQVCGNMSSGGTESILLAVKSSRDYMKEKKGIVKPEMIIPVSAHSAYDKAAQYLKIKLWRVPASEDFRADVKAIQRYVNKNTIMIVGSAPGFPHGIVDPIEELGELALHLGICFHVDLCLGGFVLPFARKLGYPIPPFDFTVQGVSSISVDIHKYGLGPKGTSVVLYRNHEIRKMKLNSSSLQIWFVSLETAVLNFGLYGRAPREEAMASSEGRSRVQSACGWLGGNTAIILGLKGWLGNSESMDRKMGFGESYMVLICFIKQKMVGSEILIN